ncbi:transposase [Rhodococcus sp. 05-2256-B1]|uniref:transposase n=1 Tax=Rhodococcus sp. 05-2256-B1 TaxID=2022518 RepID=UPI003F9343F5
MVVAKGYRPVDRDQQFLIPPDMREWLPAEHPVWTLIDIVDTHLDTSAFHTGRRLGGVGRAGYDPDMLLTLLIWAWSQSQRSSRRIESACADVVSYRVICAGDIPDHVTISRFRKDNHAACEALFAQVLILAARVGLGSLGTIALDGVKIASNASLAANRSESGLRAAAEAEAAKIAAAASAAHAAGDDADDELYGPDDPGPGHVPKELADPASRSARIAAALAQIEAEKAAARAAEQAAAKGHLERMEAGGKITGQSPVGAAVEAATIRLQRALDARTELEAAYRVALADAAAAGRTIPGTPPLPAESHHTVVRARAALAKAQARQRDREKNAPVICRNITDPQSRMQPIRGGGWVQGYNCQAFTAEDGIIIATGVGINPNDSGYYQDMVAKAVAAATTIVATRTATDSPPVIDTGIDTVRGSDTEAGEAAIGIMLFDAGYCSNANLDAPGPDRLIATGTTRDLEAAARAATADNTEHEPVHQGSLEKMRERLATPDGLATYRKRSHIAETPFGHAKHNLGFRRFTGRGLDRAGSEWSFHAAVHNIGKILTHLATTPSTAPA